MINIILFKYYFIYL